MNDSALYCIWLTMGVGYCSTKPKYLASMYSDLSRLYDGGEAEMRLSGVLTEGEINRLLAADITQAQSILDKCSELGYQVVAITDYSYPSALRDIDDPPAVLYVSGNLPDTDTTDTVAIVGTRKATVYGIKTAFELGANLSKNGFIIVSGGALGIDCASHRGVLQTSGTTVCVLGCGIDYDYLYENRAMRAQITVTGAVVSEYPPGHPSAARNFPQRNRIISGLSRGVIVVEAPKASGSMITVNLALAQSRDVFAVMGNIDSPYSQGSNMLIKDGAIPITSYEDIVEYYRGVSDEGKLSFSSTHQQIAAVPSKLRNRPDNDDYKPVSTHKTDVLMSDDERRVYYALSTEPQHIDEVVQSLGLPPQTVIRAVSSLEVMELIENTYSRYYVIK